MRFLIKSYLRTYPKQAAQKGGRIAGNARRELESETGKSVVSPRNYLQHPESEQLSAGDDSEEDDLPF
ncbi:hypothetical protein MNBD_CHLOROFLEXI01-863 [hydrothermal vent metagenome]|uniref:Uncharacterized protein n=1 Tax=hydrothermal vent metagenome TaxID=652676 RepID=A0A3B0VKQ3_9ZZZZ